jgi:hypothetical protein
VRLWYSQSKSNTEEICRGFEPSPDGLRHSASAFYERLLDGLRATAFKFTSTTDGGKTISVAEAIS